MSTPISERIAARILAGVPSLAAKISHTELTEVMTTVMAQAGIAPAPAVACPDGRAWCTGAAIDHADPREHFHKGPEQSMNGAYGYEVMTMHLVQFGDDEPRLAFVGAGDWPDLGLEETDELIKDMAVHLTRLRALRSQMAALLDARDYAEAEQHRRAEDHRDDAAVRALADGEAGR